MHSVQKRILDGWPSLRAKTPAELLRGLRSKLLKASNGGLLRTGSDQIHKWVRLDPLDVRRPEETPPDANIIVGAIKDFGRDPANARLIRDDGAWLHFTITALEAADRLQILAYDFELVFPDGHTPPFFRIDLNLPGHENEEREMRSHLHPGHDDLQARRRA
jgi:hypothetical protein